MALTIEHLYKAREFVDLKNISKDRIELTFKNPIIAMLAKGKVAEIVNSCGPKAAFTSCQQVGNDLILTFDPTVMSDYLLGRVFTGNDQEAQDAVSELSARMAETLRI
ncbi:MAG: hypothetical protein IJ022_02370 [Burkholderiaceae bacterium]|nr:hypothetical protein [Burkholderiaceae bacterium]